MNTTSKKSLATTPAAPPARADELAYEPPRITRKRSLERVTLGSGTVKPGGGVGGN